MTSTLALLCSAPVWAQDAQGDVAPASEAANPEGGLGDIVVTAQRRQESLQRAAIAVDVIGADTLAKGGVKGPDSLGTLVPALAVTPAGGGRMNFFLRGVGNFTVAPNLDSAVAFNYDGVYIGKPGSTSGFFYDLERIEVLKGPQGTLYGRNATGGAINVIPVKPKAGELSGYLTASYGNYDAVGVEGAINLPVGQNGALRVSGNLTKHDGYLSDGTSDDDSKSLRVQFAGELTPNLTVRVGGDYTQVKGAGIGASYVNSYAPGPGGITVTPSGLDPSVGLYDPRAQAFRRNLGAGGSGTRLTDLSPYSFVANDYYGVNAEVGLKTGAGTLTFISSWRTDTQNNMTPVIGFSALSSTENEQYSGELRFVGDRIGVIDYTLGAYYFHEKVDTQFNINQQALYNFQSTVQTTSSYAAFGRLTAHLSEKLRLVGGLRYTHDKRDFTADQVGLQIACVGFPFVTCPTVPLFPQVASPQDLPAPFVLPPVTGGATPIGTSGANLLRLPDRIGFHKTFTKSRPTYHAGVEYDLGTHSLLYASFETGFRSGGPQAVAPPNDTYLPEYITAWTIGSKNRLFDNRLQLNLEGFYWKYRNQQLTSITVDSAGRQGNFVKNIGRTTSYGVDAEMTFLATPTTLLNAQAQYLHTKYDVFRYTAAANPPAFTTCTVSVNAANAGLRDIDCSGNPAYNSPRWTINLGIQQTINLPEYKFVLGADTQYKSSRWTGFEFANGMLQKANWQSNAQVSFSPQDDRWSIAAFVRNIENERYKVNTYVFAIGSAVMATTSPPRTYGVRASMKF